MTASRSTVVGVDVGGTFTDLFVLDEAAGTARIVKVPSTRGDEARGFVDGIARIGASPEALATIVHGTTVATNALLERKIARTGLITTRGFRDVLEMRRRDRPRTWGLRGGFVPPVPRDLRLEVDERTLALTNDNDYGIQSAPFDADGTHQMAGQVEGCRVVGDGTPLFGDQCPAGARAVAMVRLPETEARQHLWLLRFARPFRVMD